MTNGKLQMRNERGRERGKRRTRKEKDKEKRRRQRQTRKTKKRRRQRKGCITASLYTKMIDSISANYRNYNCQYFYL